MRKCAMLFFRLTQVSVWSCERCMMSSRPENIGEEIVWIQSTIAWLKDKRSLGCLSKST